MVLYNSLSLTGELTDCVGRVLLDVWVTKVASILAVRVEFMDQFVCVIWERPIKSKIIDNSSTKFSVERELRASSDFFMCAYPYIQ